MPAVDCTISFNSPTNSYYAGQTVYGTVKIQVNKVTAVKRLVLRIAGLAKCVWSGVDKDLEDYESLLFLNVHLIPNPIDLPCGNHKYNFDFRLPSMIPSSQNRERVQNKIRNVLYEISYKATAIFVLPPNACLTFDKEFFVISGFDLNFNHDLTVPYLAEHAEMNVKVARTGWVAGEEIAFNVTLKNPNDDLIESIEFALYKDILLTYKSKSTIYCCKEKANSLICKNEVICSPGKSSYENRLTIPLTCNKPSTVDDAMKIINIQYRLVVQLKKNSSLFKSSKSHLDIPIKIASVPITQNSNPAIHSN